MYDSLPYFYDALHQELTADISFITDLAQQQNGAVLELGCGTGRLLLPLAQTGLQITGLDNADAMLAVARERLDKLGLENIALVSADMTRFSLPDNYSFCLISYNTLTHLNTSQIKNTLIAIKRHLLPDGLLLIDTINPFMLAAVEDQDTFEPEADFIDPQSGHAMTQSARYQTDHTQQTVTIEWLYENATTQKTQTATTTHRYHYPHVLQMLLNEQGYSIQDIFGDYDKTPFAEDSERLIITAR